MERFVLLVAFVAGVVVAAVFGSVFNETLVDYRLLHRYVSDEVWYVSASRNLAYALGIPPKPCREAYATIFYGNESLASMLASRLNATLLSKATAIVVPWPPPGDVLVDDATVRCCYSYPDSEGIGKYLNLEHPPVAKLIEALLMHLVGDCPRVWRAAPLTLSMLAVFSVVASSVIIASRFSGRSSTLYLSCFTASALIFFATSFRAMAGIAMLEAFAAGFGSISILLAAMGYLDAAVAAAALSTLSKYTGLAYLATILAYLRLRRGWRSVVRGVALTALVALAAYAPLAASLGITRLAEETVGGVNWFLESRPSGPPTSTPLDWLIGNASSPLSINPDIEAKPNPVLSVGGLAAGIFAVVVSCAEPALLLAGLPTLIFYTLMTLVYLAGNRTLYAFYTAVYEPAAALGLATLVAVYHAGVGLRRLATRSITVCMRLPEAKAASTMLRRGYPLAAMAAVLALHGFASGPGFLNVELATRLDRVAVAAAAFTLAAVASMWRRVEPQRAALLVLASPGLVPATATLLTLMAVVEAPALALAVLAAYPTLIGLTLVLHAYQRRPVAAIAAVAVYAALRVSGLVTPPSIGDYVVAVAAAALARLEMYSLAYLAAAMIEPSYSILAAVTLYNLSPISAVLAAAGYAGGIEGRALLALSLLTAIPGYASRLRGLVGARRDRSVVQEG